MPFATTINPWSGEEIDRHPLATVSDVETTLDTAVAAQRLWAAWSAENRAAAIGRIGEALAADVDALSVLITAEMGKPIAQARAEVEKCAILCAHYAAAADRYLADETIASGQLSARVRLRPLGVVFSITPWNFPVWQLLRFAIPTLLVGNAVTVKPAVNVIGCARRVVAIVETAVGTPSPLQLLLVDHRMAADVIADHRIAGVALTGSDRAGRTVAGLAGRALKPTLLELGGSDAFIVLEDADVGKAAEAAVRARFHNSGQVCIAAKRIIVQQKIAEAFTESFAAATQSLIVGDPTEDVTFIGPMARHDLCRQLDAQMRQWSLNAETILRGGHRDKSHSLFDPAILFDRSGSNVFGAIEAFGPLGVIQSFSSDRAAAELANASPYGLTAMIWSRDVDRAQMLADRLQVGSIFFNMVGMSDPGIPLGGVKASGFGRELGSEGVRAFANVQSLVSLGLSPTIQ
jgi:acyl-CoA reductase-like NAD-dependent aldehyde dehydrogenase